MKEWTLRERETEERDTLDRLGLVYAGTYLRSHPLPPSIRGGVSSSTLGSPLCGSCLRILLTRCFGPVLRNGAEEEELPEDGFSLNGEYFIHFSLCPFFDRGGRDYKYS